MIKHLGMLKRYRRIICFDKVQAAELIIRLIHCKLKVDFLYGRSTSSHYLKKILFLQQERWLSGIITNGDSSTYMNDY